MKKLNGFIEQTDHELLKENANKSLDKVTSSRDAIAGIVSRHVTAEYILTPEIINAHNEGYIHCHDMDYFITPAYHNCTLVNYPDMLKNGFKLGNTFIHEPSGVDIACVVLMQALLELSGSAYGGQTLAHLDVHLEPYIKKTHYMLLQEQNQYNLPNEYVEDKLLKIVKRAAKTILWQCNTNTSCNGQQSFVSISMGTSTTKYGRMFTKAYLNEHEKGIDGKTPIFPKVIYFLDENNLEPNSINYDIKLEAIRCSSKRIYPDFINVKKNLELTGSSIEPVSPMGCRSYLSKYINPLTGKEEFFGRGNLGVVTLGLPLIALDSNNSEDKFFELLDGYFDLAYKVHDIRISRFKKSKAGENPLFYMYGGIARLGENDFLENIIDKMSVSFGYTGIFETCEFLYGSYDKNKALKIMKYLNDKVQEYKSSSGLNFSLYASPYESGSYRLKKCIDRKYPDVMKHEYITNSFHTPVWVNKTPFEKYDEEKDFLQYSTGGNIIYCETPSLKHNLKALESIIDYGCEIGVHYMGINQPSDYCKKCDFSGECITEPDGFTCPTCGNKDPNTLYVIRRICGYLSLGTKSSNMIGFNTGKMYEIKERTKHL